MSRQRVLILGGGLAGLAAALALREADCHVTLVESANRLGGRATSFTDPSTGDRIDNCQHVVLGCCTNLINFYKTLKVDHLIQWHHQYDFADRDGCIHTLKPSWLPAPIHLAPSLMTMKAYSWPDRMTIANAMRSLMSASIDEHHDKTFADYLRSIGQSRPLIERFWNVVIVSACNLDCDRVEASTALFVFQRGFLAHKRAASLGLVRCPLVDLYDPAHSLLDDLRLGRRATAVNGNEQIESVTLDDGATVLADQYVCALPMHTPPSIFAPSLLDRDPRIAQANALTFSPILGVHLRFDSPVSNRPCVAFLDAPTQWIFFKDEGRRAHAVISAADDWMTETQNDIVDAVLKDLQTIAPGAIRAHLVSHHVVKEKRATFAATPGQNQHRPPTTGPIANLFMAGDHCESPWPATMEGAVQSGYRAAQAITGRDMIRPPLRESGLYRFLKHIPTI